MFRSRVIVIVGKLVVVLVLVLSECREGLWRGEYSRKKIWGSIGNSELLHHRNRTE